MAIIRCENGHFYDDSRDSECPKCREAGRMGGLGLETETEAYKEEVWQYALSYLREKHIDVGQDMDFGQKSDADFGQKSDADFGQRADTDFGQKSDAHFGRKTDPEKTISVAVKQPDNDFVAGWLVCTCGPDKGRQYTLYHGFNRIGRAQYNDISLPGDEQVPMEPQCSVVYENRKNLFYAAPQDGALSYLNGEILGKVEEIRTGDRITVGRSELTFVAFCEGERRW